MNTQGRHLLVEYHGCDCDLLDDPEQIERAMNRAAVQAGATVVASTFHRFGPQGVSGVVVIAESHLSIHTWPESGYAAVDFYTCGDCSPERAHHYLREVLVAERCEIMAVERGAPAGGAMRVASHYDEGAAAPAPRTTATVK